MKKLVAIFIAALMLLSLTALAERSEKIDIVEDRLHVYKNKLGNTYAYYCAIVENTGSGIARVNKGMFNILDADGKVIHEDGLISSTPYALMPGEKGYVSKEFIKLPEGTEPEGLTHTIDLSATKGYRGREGTEIKSKSSYELSYDPSYGFQGRFITEIFNEGPRPIYGPTLITILRDKDGRLVYVDRAGAFNVGIKPGGSILMKGELDPSLTVMLMKQGLQPTTAEGYASVTQ